MSSRPFGSEADEKFARSRRQFVQGLAAGGALLGLGLWPRQSWALRSPGQLEVLSGTQFDLSVGETLVNYTGKKRTAITVNGSVRLKACSGKIVGRSTNGAVDAAAGSAAAGAAG